MRYLLLSINDTDLIECIDARTESPVHGKDFILDNGGETEVIKDFSAISPYIDRPVFSQTFIVEAVDLCDLSTFVISADESDAIGVSYFEG